MECRVVEVIRTLERLKGRHRNKVLAWNKVRFPMAFPNVGARSTQEFVGKSIAGIGIAHPHWLAGSDAVWQTLALVDVENGVLAQHGDEAGFVFRTGL